MGINYVDKSKEFHLYNNQISYIIKILQNGQLGQLYYGKKIRMREDYGHLFEESTRDMAAYPYEGYSKFSLEHIKQEYPTIGNGDIRYPAYVLERENGSRVVEFTYVSHKIYKGKPGLDKLPATYVEEESEATSLEIKLYDAYIDATLYLLYTIYENLPVVTRSTRFECGSKETMTLHTALSASLDLPDKEYEMIDLAGAWVREREIRVRGLDYGTQGIHSMRGCSSHQFNPFVALKRKQADEHTGEVLGFSLVYSGNFLAQVEVDTYDVTRVQLGIHPSGFTWKLEKNESFQTPEVVMVYSDTGLNGMSQVYHELYRTRLCRGMWRDKERPILINNWEATYFDFNEERIMNLVDRAKDIGVELFVLDDGWFGKRNHDRSSLGDWYPNLEKIPSGIAGLSRKVEQKGLKFGLWIEPEMVNKDSDLYRQNPEWVMAEVGRNMCHSRNQYILDFTRQDVRDYIFGMLDKVIGESKISYIKWDMNRSFSEVFSNGNDKEYQGKVSHKYILGVYELYSRLTEKYPHILFESCSSGGARFDPGMLYYAPQTWTSDNTDSVSRLKIQYGTSMVYPLSSIGSHVSASPNHQTRRPATLKMRGDVAYFGTFGYELDLEELSQEELEGMREQIEFFKEKRELFQKGKFYRLRSPFEHNVTSWMVVSENKEEAYVGYYRVLQIPNIGFDRIKLQGLNPELEYEVSGQLHTSFGDELMNLGLNVSDFSSGAKEVAAEIQGDFMSRLFHIKIK